MSIQVPVNFDNTTPAALSGYQNVVWQSDVNGNLSAYLPACTSSLGGAVPTPPNVTNEYLRGDGTFAQPHLTDDADVSISSPQNGQLLTYNSSLSQWQNQTSSSSPGAPYTGDIGHRWQWNPLPGTTFAGAVAFGITIWTSTGSVSNGDSSAGASPVGQLFTTSATAGNSAGMSYDAAQNDGPLSLASVASANFILKLSQTTNMRIWIGLANVAGTVASNMRTDTPGTSFAIAAFRYSTGAGDSKYQCVLGNGSAQTATPESTSSHVDSTSLHRFTIAYVAPNVVFYIDGVQVGSSSTDAPSSSTALIPFIWIDNDSNAVADAVKIYGLRGQWAQL